MTPKPTPPSTATPFPQVVEIPVPLEIHPSVSPLAAELLMKAADAIHRDAKIYRQDGCDPSCDSACCIIGHCQQAAGVYFNRRPAGLNREETAHLLGFSAKQFDSIFYTNLWPTSHGIGHNEATPEQGIARIEHFLRTGE